LIEGIHRFIVHGYIYEYDLPTDGAIPSFIVLGDDGVMM
jgi:hypothetical protein